MTAQHTPGSFDRFIADLNARDQREQERAERRRRLAVWRMERGIVGHPDDGPVSAAIARARGEQS